MKKWIATYTADYGETYKTITVSGETYTQAYVNALIKIHDAGLIKELTEV